MDIIQDLLKKYFGYDHFRPTQKEIIDHVLNRKDCLVLMPTGGGKSLCYQLPSLMSNGLTLVISPLISLMKDQVDALKANGIPAEYINSTLNPLEIQSVQNNIMDRKIKILYIAPERLALIYFQNFLSSLSIDLIAIDEAHCISEWGHDFRPEYRNLKGLRKLFPNVPIIALTATATELVREDIIRNLHLKDSQTFISSFDRKNLTYYVQPKTKDLYALLDLLERYKRESVIIYCHSRKDTEYLVNDLKFKGFHALPYHAGLSDDVRKSTQDQFIQNEISIICATIAFGMGIDKPDIRLVVHDTLPKSLEGYYQETGRAGRDGQPSQCVLFYSYGDKKRHEYFINQMEENLVRENALKKLNKVIDFCKLQSCRRRYILDYFGEHYSKEHCGSCDRCLQDVFDGTLITQKILSAVIRTGNRYGAGYITDILLGSKSKKIFENHHESLSVYGIVDDFSKEELHQIIQSLVDRKQLIKENDDYPTLRISESGLLLLKSRSQISLPKPKKLVSLMKERKTIDQNYGISYQQECDKELFERLKDLRRKLADQKGVPPFVIFHDSTLYELAYYYPHTHSSFRRISGVGSTKLNDYGEIFINCIKEYCIENNLSERDMDLNKFQRETPITETNLITKDYILKKYSISKIAEMRKLSESTIYGHIERLIQMDNELDIEYLKPTDEVFQKIQTVFKKLGYSLKPVYDDLGGEYTFNELRLVRLFL